MAARAQVRFRDDSLREFARWAAKSYGIERLDVIWRERILDDDGKVSKGCANVFESGTQYIELSMANTYRKSIEVLAHEIAHLVVLRRCGYAGHGLKFATFLRGMIASWNRQVAGKEKKR